MRKSFLLLIGFLTGFLMFAQTKTEPYKGEFGEGTKTTTVSTDEKLNKVVTVVIKDKGGIPIHSTVWKKDIEGRWTIEIEKLKPSGRVECSTRIQSNKQEKVIEVEIKDKDGKKIFKRVGNDLINELTGEILSGSAYDGLLQQDIADIEENVLPSLEPKKVSCNTSNSTCRPQVEVFAGYSYLRGDYGLDKESFPAGIRVAAVYNLTNHIAIGVDASLNTRKIGSENLSRSFIMIEGKYVLGDMDDCDQKLFGNIRLLGGIGIEKYGPSSGSGPAFGGGAGIIRLVTKKVAVRGQVDYLAVKYKGSEELNKNLRLSGGVVFRF